MVEPSTPAYHRRWKSCWHVAPDIYQLLKESKNLEPARQKIMNYLNATESAFRNDYFELSTSEFIIFKNALKVLKDIFSKRYERIADASPLGKLWMAARDGDSDVADDFVDEFEHLFRGIKGYSKVYPSFVLEGIVPPDFDKYKGRDAAIRRSDFLDLMGDKVNDILKKYPSGLEEDIIQRREENRKKILAVFDASDEEWNDYRWQFRHVIRNKNGLEKLKKIIDLDMDELAAIKMAVENQIPFGITPYYLHLMDKEPTGFDFAVRKQVIPPLSYVETMKSNKSNRSILFDFMREHDTSPIEHITRRYPKVAILKPYDTCPQICVYCQRNWEISSPMDKSAEVSKKHIEKAVKWISKHNQIMDLLVTGGDPLIMSDHLLDSLISQLAEIPHLRMIRIATRIPVTVPQRITDRLLEILSKFNDREGKEVYIVTHFSHPYEITPESSVAIRKLRKSGMSVYNQQVFTFSNSRRFESVALRLALKLIGVDPYYMFNMKGKSEMSDYAVPVARMLQERKEEARILPGIFRTDEPVFNVPFLGKNHMRAGQDHELISILPSGKRVYAFHPWEKSIRKVDSYYYTDISIRSYLERLKELGEDIEDYKSIWYYY